MAAGALVARVLLLPVGDPQAPVAAGLPAFAGTAWPLRVTVLPSPDALLSGAPGAAAGAMTFTFTATPPADADDLFAALGIELTGRAPTTPRHVERLAKVASAHIKKQLPDSYINAFPFERPAEGTTRTDEFGCALRDTTPAVKTDPPPPNTITWGAILSFALRQPALARALGLIHDIPFPAAFQGHWPKVAGSTLNSIPPERLNRRHQPRSAAMRPATRSRSRQRSLALRRGPLPRRHDDGRQLRRGAGRVRQLR